MTSLLISLTLLFSFSSFSQDERTQLIAMGDHLRLPLAGAQNIWIQDRKILKADVVGNAVLIAGLSTGQSGFKIGSTFYKIQVVHPHEKSQFQKVQTAVKKSIGLKAEFSQGQLAILGTLYRFKDWQALAAIAKQESITYKMKATIVNSARREFSEFLQGLLKDAHLPPQAVIFDPIPEIRINASELHTQRYEQLLRPFGLLLAVDKTHLDIKPTVKVEITVAEVKKSSGLGYGLKWPQSYQAQTLGDGSAESSMIFEANAFENSGWGKILASPNILCKSGEEAEFLAGGEFPIKIAKYRTQEVLWKRYGILVKVKPVADASGRISLSIETEITTIDQAVAIDGIPGLQTNKVSSHFDITKPQVIALSGLLKNDQGKSSDGLPWLSQLPILGPLFSSKAYRENESELVIFVRPSIYQEAVGKPEYSHLLKEGTL